MVAVITTSSECVPVAEAVATGRVNFRPIVQARAAGVSSVQVEMGACDRVSFLRIAPVRAGVGSSGRVETVGRAGMLLGLFSRPSVTETRAWLGPGDTLVLYTDGFTEARRGNEFLQVEGLASLLDEFREGSAETMVESISESVSKTYGLLRDDATILVVKSVGVRE